MFKSKKKVDKTIENKDLQNKYLDIYSEDSNRILFKRFLAFCLDYLLIVIFWKSIELFIVHFTPVMLYNISLILCIGCWVFAYNILMEGSKLSGTLGKMTLGLTTVDSGKRTSPLPLSRILKRFIFKYFLPLTNIMAYIRFKFSTPFVLIFISTLIPMLAFYTMAFWLDGKAFHDVVAGSRVVYSKNNRTKEN